MQAPLNVPVASELDFEAKKVDLISHEVLGKNYLNLEVRGLELKEDCANISVNLSAQIDEIVEEKTRSIEIKGVGVGLVDAAFDGLMKAYSPEHISLAGVSIDDFSVAIKLRGTDGRKSDAYAIALLRARNSEDHEFAFSYRSPSLSQSGVAVVTQALSFFINSERAFVQLYTALDDAKKRNRSDLIERFKQQMAVLVSATSYKQVVEKMIQKSKRVAR